MLKLYGGLLVHESIVLKFEIQIVEIIQEFLGVKNMLEIEIHFREIFIFIIESLLLKIRKKFVNNQYLR